jgi:hypothetical protein
VELHDPSRELRQTDMCRGVQGPSEYRLAAWRRYKHRRSADQTAWDSEALSHKRSRER